MVGRLPLRVSAGRAPLHVWTCLWHHLQKQTLWPMRSRSCTPSANTAQGGNGPPRTSSPPCSRYRLKDYNQQGSSTGNPIRRHPELQTLSLRLPIGKWIPDKEAFPLSESMPGFITFSLSREMVPMTVFDSHFTQANRPLSDWLSIVVE